MTVGLPIRNSQENVYTSKRAPYVIDENANTKNRNFITAGATTKRKENINKKIFDPNAHTNTNTHPMNA